MAEFFAKVNLPSHMLVSELVMWVALGRLPQVEMIELSEPGKYEWVDWRRAPDTGYEGAPDVVRLPFSEAEFEAYGASIDYERYQFLWGEVGTLDEADVWRSFEKNAAIFRYNKSIRKEDWDEDKKRKEAQKEVELIRELLELEAVFEPIIDNAFATVFASISAGELRCQGWRFDESDSEPTDDLCEIPRSSWTLKNFNLRASELVCGNIRYGAVQLPVDTALARFPNPKLEAVLVNGALMGDTFVVEKAPSAHVASRPRGRPEKAQASAREVVRRVFSHRQRLGQLPAKKEAQIQEVIEYVKMAFDEEISRSTAQLYLRDLE